MKRMLLAFLLAGITCCTQAQNLPYGARVPELKALEWLTPVPDLEGKVVVYDFFHPADPGCAAALPLLDTLAARYGGRVAFVLVARVRDKRLEQRVQSGTAAYAVAVDVTGKTFGAFGVDYVPCCIIADRRGRIAWTGVPEETERGLKRLLEPHGAGKIERQNK